MPFPTSSLLKPSMPCRLLRSYLSGVIISFLLVQPAHTQPNHAAYADLLLFSQFGEFCAMCEAVLLCQQGEATATPVTALPEAGDFTVFYLKNRTFWSQIATIWEWFINNFQAEPVSGHTRPVAIYSVVGGTWGPVVEQDIHLDIEPPLLTVQQWTIQRDSGQWQRDGVAIGNCQRLELWPALDWIETNTAKVAR